jgi:glycerate kinase
VVTGVTSTVLIAVDKFKGSLSAEGVAKAVATGIGRVSSAQVLTIPVADGGDGTVAAAVAAGFSPVRMTATGPTSAPVETLWARRGDTAVIEMADVSGLVRLPGGRFEPLRATSRGLGEVIAAAIGDGCSQITVGIGGSASTDGGAGMLAALGARLTNEAGAVPTDGGGGLLDLASLDLTELRRRTAGVRFTFACDVDNPLTGPRGAAAVYGPQKGATPGDVRMLEDALTHWADLVTAQTGQDVRGVPGAGAAGGVGYGAVALLGAQLRPGIDLVLELVGFHEALATLGAHDLVITGEGSLDEQTLHGKAPAGVAAAAAAHGVPVVAVCGRSTLPTERLEQAGISAAYALVDLEPDVTLCMTQPEPLLEQLGERIAREHLQPG